MKQTPEKKEALTTNAFIPAGLQKKKDSFLGRDQENLDKFLQKNGWLVCSFRIPKEQAKRESVHPPTLSYGFSLWSGGEKLKLEPGKNG